MYVLNHCVFSWYSVFSGFGEGLNLHREPTSWFYWLSRKPGVARIQGMTISTWSSSRKVSRGLVLYFNQPRTWETPRSSLANSSMCFYHTGTTRYCIEILCSPLRTGALCCCHAPCRCAWSSCSPLSTGALFPDISYSLMLLVFTSITSSGLIFGLLPPFILCLDTRFIYACHMPIHTLSC